MLEVTFRFAPGELVDVPHLCIDGAKIKLCCIGRHGGHALVIEWPHMSMVKETIIDEDDAVLHVEEAPCSD